jgi:hypothetical protein
MIERERRVFATQQDVRLFIARIAVLIAAGLAQHTQS